MLSHCPFMVKEHNIWMSCPQRAICISLWVSFLRFFIFFYFYMNVCLSSKLTNTICKEFTNQAANLLKLYAHSLYSILASLKSCLKSSVEHVVMNAFPSAESVAWAGSLLLSLCSQDWYHYFLTVAWTAHTIAWTGHIVMWPGWFV